MIEPYPVGGSPEWVGIADLNGDGVPDLAVADAESESLAVLLGLGDGGFRAPAPLLSGRKSDLGAIRDLTGDGIPDLILNDRGSSPDELWILPGCGDGTFDEPVAVLLEGPVRRFALEDLDGNGVPDLVATFGGSGNEVNKGSHLAVRLGNGNGTFSEPVFIDSLAAVALLIADFDRDGIPDLAVTHWFSGLFVYGGNGDGTFRAPHRACTGLGPFFMTAGDLDGDGALDVVVSNEMSGLTVLRGNGDGTLVEPDSVAYETLVGVPGFTRERIQNFLDALDFDYEIDSTRYGCWSESLGRRSGPLGAGDLNGDRSVDLVVLPDPGNAIEFWWGKGDGGLASGGVIETRERPRNVAVGDINGDGIADLAVVTHGSPPSFSPPPAGPSDIAQAFLTTGVVMPQGEGLQYAKTGWGLGLRIVPRVSWPRNFDPWMSLGFRIYPGTDSTAVIDRDGGHVTVRRSEFEWSIHAHAGVQIGSRSPHATIRPRFGLGPGLYYFGTDAKFENPDVEFTRKFNHQFRAGWRAILGVDLSLARTTALNLELVFDQVWGLNQLPGGYGARHGGRYLTAAIGVGFTSPK